MQQYSVVSKHATCIRGAIRQGLHFADIQTRHYDLGSNRAALEDGVLTRTAPRGRSRSTMASEAAEENGREKGCCTSTR